MLVFKIKNIDICLFVYKHEEGYSIVSSDLEGHEGLLADGITNLKELEKMVAEVFNQKATCCGVFKSPEHLAKAFNKNVNDLV